MSFKIALLLSTILLLMASFAAGANPCVHEGKEYPHRTGLWIEGKCMQCLDGEWKRFYAPVNEARCKGIM